jgi:hypothetical protein
LNYKDNRKFGSFEIFWKKDAPSLKRNTENLVRFLASNNLPMVHKVADKNKFLSRKSSVIFTLI